MYQVAIMCPNGINTLTCVNGGGLAPGNTGVAISSDAVKIGENELFTLVCVDLANGKYALQTAKGNFVTFVNKGGIGGPNTTASPMHTDASWVKAWEKYTLEFQKSGKVAIKCPNGKNYLSAVNGGGVGGPNTTPLHTDATWVRSWETITFRII